VLFKGEYLESVVFYRQHYYRTLIVNHRQDISNDTAFDDPVKW